MERTPVVSSSLVSVGYDELTKILEVEFVTGGVYQYAGVPADEHEALMSADSKGTYMNANIRDHYSYVRIA